MPQLLTELNAHINEAQTNLRDDEIRYQESMRQLALTPRDRELRIATRELCTKVNEWRDELALLEGIREEAMRYDQTAERQAVKQKAAAHLAKAEVLMPKRTTAAKEIDKVLASLKTALDDWRDINDQCRNELSVFLEYACDGPLDNANMNTIGSVRSLRNSVCNAIAAQVHDALKGLDYRPVLAFNHLQQVAHEVELAADDAETSGNTTMLHMRTAARNAGL